jgi:hypothetical protein
MLWYKAWLETRWRLLLSLGTAGFFLALFRTMGARVGAGLSAPPPGARPIAGLALAVTSMVVVIYSWLAGTGIVTQSSFRTAKGLHGSTFFTLSLPVSRFRLLATRAGLGWLEMTGIIGANCWGMWLALPVVRGAVTGTEMFEHAVAVAACATSLYFLSVLLGTFLDEPWRMWGGMLAFLALWLLSNFGSLPASADIIRAMGEGSPMVAHTMPWTTMIFSLGSAVVLFIAAWRVVQVREY